MKISDYGITVQSKIGQNFNKHSIDNIAIKGYYRILYFNDEIGTFHLLRPGEVSGGTDCGHDFETLAAVQQFALAYRPTSAPTSAPTPRSGLTQAQLVCADITGSAGG